jgi:hypothetical protein
MVKTVDEEADTDETHVGPDILSETFRTNVKDVLMGSVCGERKVPASILR